MNTAPTRFMNIQDSSCALSIGASIKVYTKAIHIQALVIIHRLVGCPLNSSQDLSLIIHITWIAN